MNRSGIHPLSLLAPPRGCRSYSRPAGGAQQRLPGGGRRARLCRFVALLGFRGASRKMAASETVRLRLHFDYPPPASPNCSSFWLLVDLTRCRVVTDLISLIRQRFGFSSGALLGLYLDGGLLPPAESARLVRDNDCLRCACAGPRDLRGPQEPAGAGWARRRARAATPGTFESRPGSGQVSPALELASSFPPLLPILLLGWPNPVSGARARKPPPPTPRSGPGTGPTRSLLQPAAAATSPAPGALGGSCWKPVLGTRGLANWESLHRFIYLFILECSFSEITGRCLRQQSLAQ